MIILKTGCQLPCGRVKIGLFQIEQRTAGSKLNLGSRTTMFICGVSDDGERKFKPLGFVDSHQLDSAA